MKTLNDVPICYWANNRVELDFIIQLRNKIIPLEIKATINLQAKSLKSYRQKYSPDLSIRSSLANYEYNNGLLNLPLYDIAMLKEACNIYI